MGAWVAHSLLVVLVLSSTTALGFHSDPPLRHAMELEGPGWFAARFEPSEDPVLLSVSAVRGSAAFHKLVVYDEDDALLGTLDAYRDDASAYLRAGAAGYAREVRVPVSGGGSAHHDGRSFPCAVASIAWWVSTGEEGSALELPSICDGRRVGGVVAVVASDAAWNARFEIRSWDPVTVGPTSAGSGAHFLDASEFDGTSVEAKAPVFLVHPAVGVADAGTSFAVSKGLVGAFGTVREVLPHESGQLGYTHGDASGTCPCSWDGGATTRGEWAVSLEGARTAQAFLAYADAQLPPRLTRA